MVVCILALIVFSILGIFSAKYRVLAKEAFDCVFRKVTFRPCLTGLDKRIKAKAVAKMAGKSTGFARVVNRYFEALSLVFLALLLGSAYFAGTGVYNLAVYGSCEHHSTDCVFNPGVLSCGSQHCADEGCECNEVLGCEEANEYLACEGSCECNPLTCG